MNVTVGQSLYRVGSTSVREGIVEEVTKKRCVVRCWSRWFVNESSLGKDWFVKAEDARKELLHRIDEEIRRTGITITRLRAKRELAQSAEIERPQPLPKKIAL